MSNYDDTSVRSDPANVKSFSTSVHRLNRGLVRIGAPVQPKCPVAVLPALSDIGPSIRSASLPVQGESTAQMRYPAGPVCAGALLLRPEAGRFSCFCPGRLRILCADLNLTLSL